MTLDDFLKKYNKCPFCRNYRIQGDTCRNCKWRWAYGMYAKYAKETDLDRFDPTEEWAQRLNAEVTR